MKENPFDQFMIKIYTHFKKYINLCASYLKETFPKKYNFHNVHQKYSAKNIIIEVIYILKTGVSYGNYRGYVNAKTLNKHVLFLADHNVFDIVYNNLYKKYIKHNQYSKLKYLSVDSSVLLNKNGKESTGRCVQYRFKKGVKISIVADSQRIPLDIIISKGSTSDYQLFNLHAKQSRVNNHIDTVFPYILADKGYDSEKIRNMCTMMNCTPIIDYNRRNTVNKKKLKMLTTKEKVIYKKRIIVENSFSLLKKFRRVQLVYDSKISTFTAFVKLAYGLILSRTK